MFTKDDLKKIFADAYNKAANTEGIQMRQIADLLETVREQIDPDNPFENWELMLIDQIKFESPINLGLLNDLREAYYLKLYGNFIDTLEASLSKGDNSVSDNWDQIFAEAAVYLHDSLISLLIVHRSKWETDNTLIRYYENILFAMRDNRWIDTRSIFVSIASNHKLAPKIRANAETILAQIAMFYLGDFTLAEKHLTEAFKLFPDNYQTLKTQAEYLTKAGNPVEARNRLSQLISANPNDYYLFIAIGDTYLAEQQSKLAELSFLDAFKMNFLQSDSLRRLISLHANSEYMNAHADEMEKLLSAVYDRLWFKNVRSTQVTPSGISCFKDMNLYNSYRDIAYGYFSEKSNVQAAFWYQKAVDLEPAYSAAMLDTGYVLLQDHHDENVLGYFTRAVKLNNENYEAHEGLANFYKTNEQLEEALAECEICMKLRPDLQDQVFNLKGNIYYYFREFETAANQYKEAIKINNRIQIYTDNLAAAYQSSGDQYAKKSENSKAVEFYRLYAELSNSASGWNVLGNFYFKLKEWENAINSYDLAIQLNKNEVVYYDNKGLAYQELGNITAAEEAFKLAAEFDITGNADNKLGNFYYNNNQPENAIECYRKASKKDPAEPVYIENIGFVQNKMGHADEALAAYNEVIEKNLAKAGTFNSVGLIYFKKGDHPNAIDYYKKALELEPENWIYLTNLALSQNLDMQYENSIASYEKALKINNADYLNWNELGILYFKKGMYEKSINCYRNSIHLKPYDAVLYVNLALALERYNKLQEANEVIDNAPEAEDTRKKAKELWLQNFGDNI